MPPANQMQPKNFGVLLGALIIITGAPNTYDEMTKIALIYKSFTDQVNS